MPSSSRGRHRLATAASPKWPPAKRRLHARRPRFGRIAFLPASGTCPATIPSLLCPAIVALPRRRPSIGHPLFPAPVEVQSPDKQRSDRRHRNPARKAADLPGQGDHHKNDDGDHDAERLHAVPLVAVELMGDLMPGKARERLTRIVGQASVRLAFDKEKAISFDDSDDLGRFDAEAHPASRDHFRKPVGYPS